MKNTILSILTFPVLAITAIPAVAQDANVNALTAAEKGAGWQLLFNGNDLAGWHNFKSDTIKPGWQVQDGALACVDPHNAGDLATAEQYDWFELDLEFKMGEGANSGIMYHASDKEGAAWATGPEFQLEDNAKASDPERCGWLYGLYKPEIDPKTGKPFDATKPAGEWNRLRLLITPEKCVHEINGVKYFEYVLGSDDFNKRVAASKFGGMKNFAKFDKGHLVFQGDHGKVSFRNMKLRTIGGGALPVKSGEKIAFMGDSITQAGANPNGYVRLVISGLEAAGVKTEAIPAGISGHKSDQMLERLQRDALDKKPDWMTLSCGVNDVWHGDNGVPLEPYKANITKIVDQCQAAGVKVMILTSTMIGEDEPNGNNQKLAAYNSFLRDLAKEKNCLFADLNADMQAGIKAAGGGAPDGRVYTSDGVHMNPNGNKMMASGVLKAFALNGDQLEKAQASWEPKAAVEEGFISLFDGKTLKGWHKNPNKIGHGTGGIWLAEDGTITGSQDPPGSGNGGILLTDEKFGDFELRLDIKPDWGVCSGLFLRSNDSGQCLQMMVDYHDGGNVGHIYGEGTGGFNTRPFDINGEMKDGKLVGLKFADKDEKPPITYSISGEKYCALYKVNEWNEVRVVCVGEHPRITTWINGEKVCEFDGATYTGSGYDKEGVAKTLGREGSIAVQVHGGGGWPKDGKCSWKNIRIKKL
jgi:lysophospholipase L1-like esterase